MNVGGAAEDEDVGVDREAVLMEGFRPLEEVVDEGGEGGDDGGGTAVEENISPWPTRVGGRLPDGSLRSSTIKGAGAKVVEVEAVEPYEIDRSVSSTLSFPRSVERDAVGVINTLGRDVDRLPGKTKFLTVSTEAGIAR